MPNDARSKTYVPAEERFTIGVVLDKRKLDNPWVDYVWLPSAILPGVPAAAPGTVLSQSDNVTRVYAGPYEMALHSGETANYRGNLETGAPKIWVSLREVAQGHQIVGVTADPAEGESYTEAGNDIVEAVPMPPELAQRAAEFIAEHHVERVFFKRTRGGEDSDEL